MLLFSINMQVCYEYYWADYFSTIIHKAKLWSPPQSLMLISAYPPISYGESQLSCNSPLLLLHPVCTPSLFGSTALHPSPYPMSSWRWQATNEDTHCYTSLNKAVHFNLLRHTLFLFCLPRHSVPAATAWFTPSREAFHLGPQIHKQLCFRACQAGGKRGHGWEVFNHWPSAIN